MINTIRTTAAAATAASLMSFAQAAPLSPIPDDQTVRNVVLVHGAFADGSGWRGVYDDLTARGYRVTIVQNPLTSLADDVSATIRALRQDEIIGVSSWSQTILRMVDNIHPLKGAKARYVVQILGGMGDASVQIHATQLTARLARLTGGEPRLLLVQGITSSREAKLVMLADPVVRESIDLFGRLSLAIIGIGAVQPSELLALSGNVFSRQEIAMLQDAGAVGEISYRFYDADGKPVETPLNERVIGISLADLRKADRVMALAGGESKTRAIAGALRLGIIDVLVTDKFTAARLTA